MHPNIGIYEETYKRPNKTLTVLLANETLLYMKTRKFHWNISGNSSGTTFVFSGSV